MMETEGLQRCWVYVGLAISATSSSPGSKTPPVSPKWALKLWPSAGKALVQTCISLCKCPNSFWQHQKISLTFELDYVLLKHFVIFTQGFSAFEEEMDVPRSLQCQKSNVKQKTLDIHT